MIEEARQVFGLVDLPRNIEQHAPPGKSGCIDDLAGQWEDEFIRLVSGSVQYLPERNETVEETLLPGREKRDGVCRKADPIPLLDHIRVPSLAGDSPDTPEKLWAGGEKPSGQGRCRIEREPGFVASLHQMERACGVAPTRNLDAEGKREYRHWERPTR